MRLPDDHPYFLRLEEHARIRALPTVWMKSNVGSTRFPRVEQAFRRLITRGFAEVETILVPDALLPHRFSRIVLTATGAQCLALHRALDEISRT